MKTIFAVFVYLFLMSSVGCASTDSIRKDPLTDGISATFPASIEKVSRASRIAVLESGMKVVDQTKLDNGSVMLIGEAAMSMFSSGEVVRLVISSNGMNQSQVLVITHRKVATQVMAQDNYSTQIFKNITANLDR